MRQPALPIEVYDTTGASEVFRGAFIYGTLQGWPLDRCLPFANAAAALNCRHLGGTGGIPRPRRSHPRRGPVGLDQASDHSSHPPRPNNRC